MRQPADPSDNFLSVLRFDSLVGEGSCCMMFRGHGAPRDLEGCKMQRQHKAGDGATVSGVGWHTMQCNACFQPFGLMGAERKAGILGEGVMHIAKRGNGFRLDACLTHRSLELLDVLSVRSEN